MAFKKVMGALLCSVLAGFVQAATVVDTGTPSAEPWKWWSLSSTRFYAGEFSLPEESIVTGLSGYFSTDAGSIAISLYADGGDTPGALFFTQSLTTSKNTSFTWQGLSGLNLDLAAGNYWLSFRPSYADTGYSTMPGSVSFPMEAYAQGNGSDWARNDELSVGMRVDATVVAVPEPASAAMYGLGLLALGCVARRRMN